MQPDLYRPRPGAGIAGRERARFKKRALLCACAAMVASCGGGGEQSSQALALAMLAAGNNAPAPAPAPAPTPGPEAQPPALQARCAMDASVEGTLEEKRLHNKLAASDALSFSAQLLQASGFDEFGPEFALKLCKDGVTDVASYEAALTLAKAEGQKLWQAALDRAQGRKVEGTLAASDDRVLYWARLTMTLALRQWKPEFAMDGAQRAALQSELDRASRGQYAIDFPEGPGYKRILVSGFDPFSLGGAGATGPSVRFGNPSGAAALALDGHTVKLADGTTAVIRAFTLPVNYGPFIEGMQEDTLGPWFKPSSKRVDASITISQGSGLFTLEHFNGRYHVSFAGNDGSRPTCADGYPATEDCDIHPPERWLGYAS